MGQYLVFIGAIATLLAGFSYIKNTLKGTTKPNRVTWLMWTVGPFIATAAAISDGVEWAVIPVFGAGFIPLLVLLASFVNKKSYWKLRPFDYACGGFSILALILWGITKEPNIAIALTIASDTFAATPTILKAMRKPQTETTVLYFIGILAALTSFTVAEEWNFSNLGFPTYLVIINSILVFAGWKHYLKKLQKK